MPSGEPTRPIAKVELARGTTQVPVTRRSRVTWVVAVYVVCAAALALSIYARWFR